MSESRVALVTGASRGIGRAISIDLAQHGYDLVLTARSLDHSVESFGGTLRETAERVEQLGRRAHCVRMDLTDLNDVRQASQQIMDEVGRVDVLVTCATYIDFSPDGSIVSEFASMNWDSLQRHIVVNCMSTPLLLRLFLPGMIERGSGLVINVTQNCFWLNLPDLPMPGHGICGSGIPLTRGLTDRIAPALARELKPHGVTILTFDPGMTLAQDSERFPTITATGYVPEEAHSVLVPARAVSHLATCHDPSRFNGQLVIALDLVREVGLLTEAEIMPPWQDGVQDVAVAPPLNSAGRVEAVAQ